MMYVSGCIVIIDLMILFFAFNYTFDALPWTKPFTAPMLDLYHLVSEEQTVSEILSEHKYFHSRKCIWKCCLENVSHFVVGSLLPVWHQAIVWTSAGLLLFGCLGTNFNEIGIKNNYFHSRKCFWKCHLQNQCRPFYFGLSANQVMISCHVTIHTVNQLVCDRPALMSITVVIMDHQWS